MSFLACAILDIFLVIFVFMKKKNIVLGIIVLLIGGGIFAYYLFVPTQKNTSEISSKTLSGMSIPLVGTHDHIQEMKAILPDMENMIAVQNIQKMQQLSLLLHDIIGSMSAYTLSDLTQEQLRYIDQQNTLLRDALSQGDWRRVELYFQKIRLLQRL